MSLDILKKLHESLATSLLERIQSGEATAADFSAAAKFLKDNSITVDPKDDETMDELDKKLKEQAERRKKRLTPGEAAEVGNVVDFMSRSG